MWNEKTNKIIELQNELGHWEKQARRFYQLKIVDGKPLAYGYGYIGVFADFIDQQEATEKADSEREKVEAIVRDLLEREQPWKKK